MTGQERYSEWLHDVMVRHRVILRNGVGRARLPRDPNAIIARVPDIAINRREADFPGEPRLLRLRIGQRTLSFRARMRPVPPQRVLPLPSPRRPEVIRIEATDDGGRVVPVCLADPVTRTIDLLADPVGAERVDAAPDAEPPEALYRALIERPVEAILRAEKPPKVGSQVRQAVGDLFRIQPPDVKEQMLLNERTFLERVRRTSSRIPERLCHRLHEITRRLAGLDRHPARPVIPPERLARQVAWLTRLVRNRACAALRFTSARIEGIVNPGPEGTRRGRGPLRFLVRLNDDQTDASVFVWRYSPDGRRSGQMRCLGDGAQMLETFKAGLDPFALVDLVLNYIENNAVGICRRSRVPVSPAVLLEEP